MYSNADPHSHLHSQVIITRSQEEIPGEPEAKVLSRSCFVPEGRVCFGLLDEPALGDSSHPHLSLEDGRNGIVYFVVPLAGL